MNTTKDGIEVKQGQVWADLDKRMDGRHVRVVGVQDGKATVQRCRINGVGVTHKVTKLSVSRMHKSSTGWALVSGPGAPA